MEGIRWVIDTVIFAIIASISFVLLVVSLALGELFDFASHDVDIDIGGHDIIDIDQGAEFQPASIVNIQTILVFTTVFGATGWVLSGYFSVAPVWSALLGIVGGFIFAIPAGLIYRLFRSQSATSSFQLDDMVSRQATVVLAIPNNGVGRIQYERGGSTITSIARSHDGTEISTGSQVVVEQVIGAELYVKKA